MYMAFVSLVLKLFIIWQETNYEMIIRNECSWGLFTLTPTC